MNIIVYISNIYIHKISKLIGIVKVFIQHTVNVLKLKADKIVHVIS